MLCKITFFRLKRTYARDKLEKKLLQKMKSHLLAKNHGWVKEQNLQKQNKFNVKQ